MINPSQIEEYNYSTFVGSEDFLSFRTAVPVGSTAPDFTAIPLDGSQSMPISACWQERDVVIEFGSLT